MAYSEKVVDHYNNPRNVGSFSKDTPGLGTGLVGAPECGDVMKLQIKVKGLWSVHCNDCGHNETLPLDLGAIPVDETVCIDRFDAGIICRVCKSSNLDRHFEGNFIEDAKFKTFGCGSAIASSSLATEWLKGKTLEEAGKIKNTDIVNELKLPPVKIHCSVLAEDAIKAAIEDFKSKNSSQSQIKKE